MSQQIPLPKALRINHRNYRAKKSGLTQERNPAKGSSEFFAEKNRLEMWSYPLGWIIRGPGST